MNYLLYWKPKTVRSRNDTPMHIASNQLRKVKSGDVVWIVTIDEDKFLLHQRFPIGQIVSQEQAETIAGNPDLWKAKYHAISQGSIKIPSRRIDIANLGRKLRFQGKKERLPKNFTGQHLQAMRTLTEESVSLLNDAWNAALDGTSSRKTQLGIRRRSS